MSGPQRRSGGAGDRSRPRRRPRRIGRQDRLHRARRRHQPGRQGRQGRPALQLHRPGRRRRRRRHRRRRLRQGQGGAGRDRQGRRGGQEELLQGPPDPGHHPAPRPGREGRGRGAAAPGRTRYRRHRRWPGTRRARVRRHPRRAEQVARLQQRHQHRARDGPGPARPRVARLRGRAPWAAPSRTSLPRRCCGPGRRRGRDGPAQGAPDPVGHRAQAEPARTRCARSASSGSATWSSRRTARRSAACSRR